MNDFEVIIMVTEDHLPMLERMLPFCKRNVKPKKIYAVGAQKIKKRIENLEGVVFWDEDNVFEGLNFQVIADLIEMRTGERKRAGWYFQQFLKMAWAYRCNDACYISLDADTFVLNPVNFRDGERYCFTPKIEYHAPYFDTINVLFQNSIQRKVNFSFIAENMIFDCDIMKKMIAEIERNQSVKGDTFFTKIINAVDKEHLLRSGFSEFETYGNYIYTNYPERVKERPLRTMRESVQILGGTPQREQLEWASRDYDIVSIESVNYKKTIITSLTAQAWFRKIISMKKLVHFRHNLRTVYRKIMGKEDFSFEEY